MLKRFDTIYISVKVVSDAGTKKIMLNSLRRTLKVNKTISMNKKKGQTEQFYLKAEQH